MDSPHCDTQPLFVLGLDPPSVPAGPTHDPVHHHSNYAFILKVPLPLLVQEDQDETGSGSDFTCWSEAGILCWFFGKRTWIIVMFYCSCFKRCDLFKLRLLVLSLSGVQV